MKVGQRVIYYKKGNDHVAQMDACIGKTMTIDNISKNGEWVYFRDVDDMYRGYRFDINAVKPITTKVR